MEMKARAALAGRRAGEVGLAAAGRAVHEDAAAGALVEFPKDLRILERVNDVHPHPLDHVLHAANVIEGHARAGVEAGVGRGRLVLGLRLHLVQQRGDFFIGLRQGGRGPAAKSAGPSSHAASASSCKVGSITVAAPYFRRASSLSPRRW